MLARGVTRGILSEFEGIGGQLLDVGVVADDARQRAVQKSSLLLIGEDAFSLPPEPEETASLSDSAPSYMQRKLQSRRLPVPITDGLHLPPDQAGEQRPRPGAWQELFKQPSEPNVDIVGMFVHVEYLLGNPAVSNDLFQIS